MPLTKKDSTPFRFGSAPRFPEDVQQFSIPVPGPIYDIPSTFDSGLTTLDKMNVPADLKRKKPVIKPEMPTTDRTSWLTGGRSERHQNPGPKYTPKWDVVTPRQVGIAVQTGSRFETKKRFVNKEMLRDNLLRESPGAKYEQVDINLTKKKAPSHTFSGAVHRPRVNQHYAYLEHYMGEAMPGVGPAEYDTTKWDQIGGQKHNGSTRVTIGQAKRFQSSTKGRFISTKHSKHNRRGLYSPGPKYNPQGHSIEARLKPKKRIIPSGGAYPVGEGNYRRTTVLRPKRVDRSAFLHAKNVKGDGGALEKTLKYYDDSPGPGAYNLPSTFHQWGNGLPGYYDKVVQKQKKRKGRSTKGSQSARRPPRRPKEMQFAFKNREARLEKSKRVLLKEVMKVDKQTGELMLPLKNRTAQAIRNAPITSGANNLHAVKAKKNASGRLSKTQQVVKKKEIQPINNPFKSRSNFIKDQKNNDYRPVGQY